MKSLTQQTSVPLGWVFALLSCSGAALIAAVTVGARVATIEARQQSSADRITQMQSDGNATSEFIRSVDQRLSRIEGFLKIQVQQTQGEQ